MKLKCINLLAAMTICLPLQQAFCAPVENVQVQVIDVQGGTSQPLLQKMSSSMEVVAEQLLLDKDTETLAKARGDYERLLTEVADRVFTGYEVQRSQLYLGVGSRAEIFVRPWSQTIKQAEIDLQFSGVEPQTAEILEERLGGLRQVLANTINGASLEATDWASSVLRKLVRQKVEAQLPEFKAAVDLVQENNRTIVQVIVYPVGQLVTQLTYELRSEAIPNLLLMQLKYKYLAESNRLRGLPVDYVKRHRQELEKRLMEKLLKEPEIKRYQLIPVVKLEPGANLGVNIRVDSNRYKIWLEGYGDIGRDKDNLSGKAHIGKFVSSRDEVFAESELILDEVQWRHGFGYARYWGKSSWSYMRRIPVGENVYKFEYELSPKWRFRAEHHTKYDRNEFGIRYRIHEFLGAEAVYGGKEFYFRVIGNL